MRVNSFRFWLALTFAARVLDGQTVINGSRSILGVWDASGAAAVKPFKSGAALPATCAQGEFFFRTGAEAHRRLYACVAANTWEREAYNQGTLAQLPAACDAGQIFFATDASPGINLYFCTTAGNPGVWTAMSAGVTGVFGRTGAVTAASGDYNFGQISGTLAASQIADGTTGTGAFARAASAALTSAALTAPTFSGPVGSDLNLGANAGLYEVANEGSTGTSVNKLAKLTGAPSTAVTSSVSDVTGIAGVCVAGCGTTGNAQLARSGRASCLFDGATTAGNYVQASVTAAGNCHDAGASFPAGGQVLGRVLSTNAAAGVFAMTVFPPGLPPSGGALDASSIVSGRLAAARNTLVPATGAGHFFPTGFPVLTAGSLAIDGPNQTRAWQFVLPFAMTVNKLVFLVTTGSGTCSGTCGLRLGIYNSSCTSILAQTIAITSGGSPNLSTTGAKSAPLITPVTLDPGVYHLAFSTDSTALRYETNFINNTAAYLNASQPRVGQIAVSTGSGAALTLPASCGTLNAFTGAYSWVPTVMFE